MSNHTFSLDQASWLAAQMSSADRARCLYIPAGVDAKGDTFPAVFRVPDDLETVYASAIAAAAAMSAASLNAIALMVYANTKQWALATGGYTATVNGVSRLFDTSTEGQALMTGKQLRLQQVAPPASVNWQFGMTFVDIPTADFTAIAIAVADFVQATFDALKTVVAGINAGTITTQAAVDAAAWPANHG